MVGRSWNSRVLVNVPILLALLVSACSSGAPAQPTASGAAPTTQTQPTPLPQTGAPASTSTTAAQPAAADQPEQRSVQAGGCVNKLTLSATHTEVGEKFQYFDFVSRHGHSPTHLQAECQQQL